MTQQQLGVIININNLGLPTIGGLGLIPTLELF